MTKIWISIIFITSNIYAQDSNINIADSLYVNGNYSKAIVAYKKHNNQAVVLEKIAKAFIALGNYDAALLHFKESIKANPNNGLLKYEYAKLLARTKHYKEASLLFEDLVYKDYNNPNYHYELGVVLAHLKDSSAVNRFRTAFNLDSTHQKAIYKIAKYNLVKRKHEIVETYVNIGLKTYERNIELINIKALNYYYMHDYLNAAKWFEKLIELGESSEFIHEKLSLCFEREYEYEKALIHRKKVLKFNPMDATSMYVIGTYYQKLEDYVNAEKYINQALLLLDVPIDDEYQKLGTVLNHQKKHKEAIIAFQKAIKENPENISSHFFLVLTKDKYYKDVAARIVLFEDFIEKFPDSPYAQFARMRLIEIKEAQFLKQD
ncbi:hypothetical protein A9Q87_02975 [Flavobacteriales bacterium 34_180_T64]|nr:hypothetical protein A9Q87_02975 [Flavobacteriales bacterium 34_180_T64]